VLPFISLLVAVAYSQLNDIGTSSVPIVPPVMIEIARCESGQRQFDDTGHVVKNYNKNGTIDYGYFQINSSHIKEAKALGFDIKTPEGNIGYAYYLYHASSTAPWNSSKFCWAHRTSDV
jgi:hypothetical protein